MYKLYNVKRWGSISAHLVLEELGVPYQNMWMTAEQVRAPEFREISPLGLIPALGLPDGRAIAESAAIVAFLTDAHPDKGLAPPIGSDDHARLSLPSRLHGGQSLHLYRFRLRRRAGLPTATSRMPRSAARRSNYSLDALRHHGKQACRRRAVPARRQFLRRRYLSLHADALGLSFRTGGARALSTYRAGGRPCARRARASRPRSKRMARSKSAPPRRPRANQCLCCHASALSASAGSGDRAPVRPRRSGGAIRPPAGD